eukprot:g82899.t1
MQGVKERAPEERLAILDVVVHETSDLPVSFALTSSVYVQVHAPSNFQPDNSAALSRRINSMQYAMLMISYADGYALLCCAMICAEQPSLQSSDILCCNRHRLPVFARMQVISPSHVLPVTRRRSAY